MPCVTKIEEQIILGNGYKIITGSFKMDSGYSDTEYLNLVNYFPAGNYPFVTVDCSDGYIMKHNQGASSGGTIRCYQFVANTDTVNSVDANFALYECHTGLDMSAVNARFMAIGKSY